jgi:hypothetical protein
MEAEDWRKAARRPSMGWAKSREKSRRVARAWRKWRATRME